MARAEVGDWMYTGKRALVAHWSPSRIAGTTRWSTCGIEVPYGTGQQSEYEHAATLKHCANCIRLGAPQ